MTEMTERKKETTVVAEVTMKVTITVPLECFKENLKKEIGPEVVAWVEVLRDEGQWDDLIDEIKILEVQEGP